MLRLFVQTADNRRLVLTSEDALGEGRYEVTFSSLSPAWELSKCTIAPALASADWLGFYARLQELAHSNALEDFPVVTLRSSSGLDETFRLDGAEEDEQEWREGVDLALFDDLPPELHPTIMQLDGVLSGSNSVLRRLIGTIAATVDRYGTPPSDPVAGEWTRERGETRLLGDTPLTAEELAFIEPFGDDLTDDPFAGTCLEKDGGDRSDDRPPATDQPRSPGSR